MMTGGWTNGETFIPFAQSLLSTRDEKQMVGPNVRIDCRTLRGKRRAMAKTKGTLVVQHMVKQAHKAGYHSIMSCLTHGFPVHPSWLRSRG